MADAGGTRLTEDLVLRLEAQQRTSRRVMAALAGVLVVVAFIVAGAVAASYFELRDLRAETDQLRHETTRLWLDAQAQQRETAAREHVLLSESLRQMEDLREETLASAGELASTRRNLGLEARAAHMTPAELRAFAGVLARRHFTGLSLDWASQGVLARALEDAAVDGDERTLIRAALADWSGRRDEARALLTALKDDGATSEMQGFGDAGLAAEAYARANASNYDWAEGCADAARIAGEAVARGVVGPNLYYYQGQCLRKRGRIEDAYEAYRRADALVDAAPEIYDLPWQPHRYRATHGIGTTLIALGADLAPGAMLEIDGETFDPRVRALELLNQAAEERRAFGASDVGIAFSRENIGLVLVQRGDWEGALEHTAAIDAVVAMTWNLTVRWIAATELLNALDRDSPAARRAELEAIALDAELKLARMPYKRFDEDELVRLLPDRYASVVEHLMAPARARAMGG